MVICAQNDSIVQLKEVVLTDISLQEFSSNVNKLHISDSVIKTNTGSLVQLLSNNSAIYFKENGRGMVASPSFRGTTAQQTAVIWNGININSLFNGQTDFNVVNPSDFNSITIRSGGGSVLYGSGAVGGSIHLNNDIPFLNSQKNDLQIQYGSFETFHLNYKFQKASKKWLSSFSITRNQSVNDYDYIGYDKKNENGNYENVSFNSVFGYQLNSKNSLKLFSYFYNGERNFSGTISSPSNSKYIDLNFRNLLEWQNTSIKGLVSKVKLAYLNESYKYYENKNIEIFSNSEAKKLLLRSNLLYKGFEKLKFNSIVEVNHTTGKGSNLPQNEQTILSSSVLMSHLVNEKLNYEISLRNEITSNYKSPLLYSIALKYQPVSLYTARFNLSKNFRIPTFNDLYWQNVGNPNLKPEESLQLEISQDLHYKTVDVTITGFYNKLTDMLRWVPNISGVWQPINTDKVAVLGIESVFKYRGNFKKIQYNFQANYTYTSSQNSVTQKQLIYVPMHRFVTSLGLHYKNVALLYQYNWNGLVYTSSDNKNELPSYGISNLYLNYTFVGLKKITLGGSILNIENKPYQNVLSRPMPGRHYMFNLNLIF